MLPAQMEDQEGIEPIILPLKRRRLMPTSYWSVIGAYGRDRTDRRPVINRLHWPLCYTGDGRLVPCRSAPPFGDRIYSPAGAAGAFPNPKNSGEPRRLTGQPDAGPPSVAKRAGSLPKTCDPALAAILPARRSGTLRALEPPLRIKLRSAEYRSAALSLCYGGGGKRRIRNERLAARSA